MVSSVQPFIHQETINITTVLKSHYIFSDIPEKVFDEFVSQAVIQQLPKGKLLFLHNDNAEYFYIVVSGWVKLFRETLDGNEAVIDVLNDGCVFGETAIFEDNVYHCSAELVENCTIISLPLRLLKTQMEASHELSMKMFGAMSRYRRQQDQKLEHRDLQSAPQRIGCFLLRLCKQDQLGAVSLHLPYDKSLIASRLGMKPETFSRALARLQKETGIRIQGSTVHISSIEQLSRYSCSACSSSFPCENLA